MPKVASKVKLAGVDIFSERESNVQSYARSYPSLFDRAQGVELWDTNGRRYLDFLAGAGSLNYGHNNPLFKEALISYIATDGITHSLDLHTTAKASFLRALQDNVIQPLGVDYVVQFTGPTGTNAVEAAIKIARKVTGRSNIISFTNGFHGVTMGSLSLTGSRYFRQAAGLQLQGVTPMPYDGYFGPGVDTMDYLERMVSDPASGVDEPAAVIVETVQGEGGLTAAGPDWLRRLEAFCRDRNILLIVDDIQAGCGRTGSFFSFVPAGLRPDLATLSKSLSGYGLPLAVVLIKRQFDVWKPSEHNGTFRGNNHAFVTAAAALDHYWCGPGFAEEIASKSDHLEMRLQAFADKHPEEIPQLRGRGMMRGLLFRDAGKAAEVTRRAFRDGLIIERSGPFDEVVKFLMPLTISMAQLDEGLDIVGSAIDRVLKRARRSGQRAYLHHAR
jgi:diaminobutyrate-2-oxoglutarate transaminase